MSQAGLPLLSKGFVNGIDGIVMSDDQLILRYILLYFSRAGHAPTPRTIQQTFAIHDLSIVHQALDRLEAERCLYRDPNSREIVAAYPFSASPTAHVVSLPNGHSLFAMCAVDALGIPPLLDTDATIVSTCAQCRNGIVVGVRSGQLQTYLPQTTQVWYIERDPQCVSALERCPHINFFCSPDHLERWQASHAPVKGHGITLVEAFEHARERFAGLLRVDDKGA